MKRPRVILIHWKAAETPERLARLAAAGYRPNWLESTGPELLRALRADPPAAFVIDLSRLPSHGREVALALRQTKATRVVPLVFVDGESAKVARIRSLLPDAVYTGWSEIGRALTAALSAPVAAPVVPASVMAGYSGTPLPKKLGIHAGSRVALSGAPADFTRTLDELPEGVHLRHNLRGAADLVLWFVRSQRELERGVSAMARRLTSGALWILWPKRASGVQSDLSEKLVRAAGLACGLVDYKICAVDATWSGLKFAHRKSKRAGQKGLPIEKNQT